MKNVLVLSRDPVDRYPYVEEVISDFNVSYSSADPSIVYDYLVVIGDYLPLEVRYRYSVLVLGEPFINRLYSPQYIMRFDVVFGCDLSILSSKTIYERRYYLPPHVGRSMQINDYRKLFELDLRFHKLKIISCVVSTKIITPQHVIRNKIVNKLESFNDLDIDFFGRGRVSVDDKVTALAPYKFSICIENSTQEGYISEKFYDCIYTLTIPIYFTKKCVVKGLNFPHIFVDIESSTDEMYTMLKFINMNADKLYEVHAENLIAARKRILTKESLFARIIDLTGTLNVAAKCSNSINTGVFLYNDCYFRLINRLLRIARYIGRLFNEIKSVLR